MSYKRFNELLATMKIIHESKNHDYAGENYLSNFTECEEFGIPAWKGVLVRMTDKWRRLVNLSKNDDCRGKVGSESIKDTLMDLACYSLIEIILREFEEDRQQSKAAHTALDSLQ